MWRKRGTSVGDDVDCSYDGGGDGGCEMCFEALRVVRWRV